ncbi:MAG: hypothetical protein LBC06_01175 [Rickettsiales bacterium]|jgi:hypothetical protein|nr:hypothetical protein [Rickettsiales bacterium]
MAQEVQLGQKDSSGNTNTKPKHTKSFSESWKETSWTSSNALSMYGTLAETGLNVYNYQKKKKIEKDMYAAKIAELTANAEIEMVEFENNAVVEAQDFMRTSADFEASFASSGFQLASGSAQAAMEFSAMNFARNMAMDTYINQIRQQNYANQIAAYNQAIDDLDDDNWVPWLMGATGLVKAASYI